METDQTQQQDQFASPLPIPKSLTMKHYNPTLPSEMLVKIFSNFSLNQMITKFRGVSRGWNYAFQITNSKIPEFLITSSSRSSTTLKSQTNDYFFQFDQSRFSEQNTLYVKSGRGESIPGQRLATNFIVDSIDGVEKLIIYQVSLTAADIVRMLYKWTELTELQLIDCGNHFCPENWNTIFKTISQLKHLNYLALSISCRPTCQGCHSVKTLMYSSECQLPKWKESLFRSHSPVSTEPVLNFEYLEPSISKLKRFYVNFDNRPGHFPQKWTNLPQLFNSLNHEILQDWGVSFSSSNNELYMNLKNVLVNFARPQSQQNILCNRLTRFRGESVGLEFLLNILSKHCFADSSADTFLDITLRREFSKYIGHLEKLRSLKTLLVRCNGEYCLLKDTKKVQLCSVRRFINVCERKMSLEETQKLFPGVREVINLAR